MNEYKKYLINKGYAVMVNHRPSTVYDYLVELNMYANWKI